MSWVIRVVTAVLTAIFAPAAILVCKLLARYLKEWAEFLVEAILINLGRIFKHSVASRISLIRYCRLQLAGQSQYLIVPTGDGTPLLIDRIFIPLSLEESGGRRSLHYSELREVGKRVRVVGEPGSGKSSLVKRISRDICFDTLAGVEAPPLPIVIELRKVTLPHDVDNNQLGVWFYRFILETVRQSDVYKMDECFDLYARGDGLVLLLDGLDEVAASAYQRMEVAIKDLSEHLSRVGYRNVIVLTMRIQFHQQVHSTYCESFPVCLHLKPFSPTEIYEFLSRWPFPRQEAAQKIARIYEELTTRPSLRDMCRNPLILSMYVAEGQSSKHLMAPESRTDFYSKVTAELLMRRRLRQLGASPGHSKLREQRERILGTLALEHLLDDSQPANSLCWSEGLRVVQDVTGCDAQNAEATFLELARETGIIAEERPGESFRFIQLTFCEFLAAFEAARGREEGWGMLIAQHTLFVRAEHGHLKARLLEVIPFASALLLPRARQDNAINDLAELGDSRLLARCFFETKMYENPLWEIFAKEEQARFLETPEDLWVDEWLRDLHLFSAVIRDAAAVARSYKRVAIMDVNQLFAMLLDKQEKSLGRLLSAYAEEDAAAAFFFAEVSGIDLAQKFPELVIAHCDQAPFFSLVFGKATEGLVANKYWRALLVEAGLRSPVVSRYLESVRFPVAWERELAVVPRRDRWFAKGIIEKGVFNKCLTLALFDQDSANNDWKDLPDLQVIGRLPKPGGMMLLRYMRDIGNLFWWGGVIVMYFIVLRYLSVGGVFTAGMTGMILLWALGVGLFFLVVCVFHARRMVYVWLIGNTFTRSFWFDLFDWLGMSAKLLLREGVYYGTVSKHFQLFVGSEFWTLASNVIEDRTRRRRRLTGLGAPR